MATSGTETFTVNAGQIINAALRKIGVLASGASASTQQSTDALQALNLMAQSWRPKGLKVWARGNATLTLTADTTSYTIGPGGDVDMGRPIRILDAYRRDSSGKDTPVGLLTKQQYNALSDKDASGITTHIYYDPQDPLGVIYPWPVVSTTGYSLIFDVLKRIQDFTATTDTPDFPTEWFEALVFNLAMRLAPEFNRRTSEEVKFLAQSTLRDVENSDYETGSVFFVPAMG